VTVAQDQHLAFKVPQVPVRDLHQRLSLGPPVVYPQRSLDKPLTAWRMEDDDAPILRHIYRHFRPRRHLEFGTWQGTGVVYVLEECDATVWTINLLRGELTTEGEWAYGSNWSAEQAANEQWFGRVGSWVNGIEHGQGNIGCQTDALGFIGRFYLEANFGHRVCQIYADSREWDISNYPAGFFDTCLIDGGHQPDIVASDTRKALALVRSGGLVMWHDFCPVAEVMATCPVPRGVVGAIQHDWEWLRRETSDLFWINPSHILIGVRGD